MKNLHATCLLAVMVATGALANDNPFALEGEFAVSGQGAATYHVALSTPPGVGLAQPQLGLAYNSGAGNGLLGVGWQLTGLSVITRCPTTVAQDGVRGSVSYDANDRFCLDGQRLMVTAGTYGAPSSKYKTEIDGQLDITASATLAGLAPASFAVRTKDGLTMLYGASADSRVRTLASSNNIRLWALNKVVDKAGNTMTVTYNAFDPVNGDHFPLRIDYTSNPTAVPALTAKNSVVFQYESRGDQEVTFSGGDGSLIRDSVRLKAIVASSPTAVTTTSLGYESASPTSGRSRLNKVTVCATRDGVSECAAPTTFTWANGGGGVMASPSLETWGGLPPGYSPDQPNGSLPDLPGNPDYEPISGDFNGDGLSDVYFVSAKDSQLCLGQKGPRALSCTTSARTWRTQKQYGNTNGCLGCYINGEWANTVGDFDSDGATDILFTNKTSFAFCSGPKLAAGDCRFIALDAAAQNAFDFSSRVPIAGDFNADGRQDLFLYADGVSYFCPGPGVTAGFNCVAHPDGDWASKFQPTAGDFDGDGATDLMLFGGGQSYFCSGDGLTLTSSTTACRSIVSGADWRGDTLAGDFNGDGVDDLLLTPTETTSYFCPGPGISKTANCTATTRPMTGLVGDFNGDGVADVVRWSATGLGTSKVVACPGQVVSGGASCTEYTVPSTGYFESSTPLHRRIVGDFNGDGVVDLLLQPRINAAKATLVAGAAGRADLLTVVAEGNGVGRAYRVTYGQTGTATKTTTVAGAARMAIAQTWPVVTSVDQPGGVVTYAYDTPVFEVGTGRGFLGFAWSQTVDAHQLVTRTYWNQNFPTTGRPARSTRGTSPATPSDLGETLFTYRCADPATGAVGVCQPAAGRWYVPFASSTLSRNLKDLFPSNDVSQVAKWGGPGAGLPGQSVTRVIDAFGNVTSETSRTLNADGTDSGWRQETTNVYGYDLSSRWLPGRLLRQTVKAYAPNQSVVTRTTAYDYEPTTGFLSKEVVAVDDVTRCYAKLYGYDDFGGIASTTTRNCNGSAGTFPGSGAAVNTEALAPPAGSLALIAPRTSTHTVTYGADGRVTSRDTNALGHTTTTVSQDGLVLSVQGPNALTDAAGAPVFTRWKYSPLGRKVLEARPDGNGTKWVYATCGTSCPVVGEYTDGDPGGPTTAAYAVTEVQVLGPIDVANGTTGGPNGPTVKTFYSALAQPLRTVSPGFDGAGPAPLLYTDTKYDQFGNVTAQRGPYGATQNWSTGPWRTMRSDKFGRVVQTVASTQPAGDGTRPVNRTTVVPDGLVVTTVNALNQSTRQTRDVTGRLVEVRDAKLKTVTFAYDPFGGLAKTTDALGNVTQVQYDASGRKLSTLDPDLGSWTYAYDVLGQVRRVVDAKQQATVTTYDLLGRRLTRSAPGFTASWVYDSCPQGVGQVCTVVGNAATRTHAYDRLGRPSSSTLTVATPATGAAGTYRVAMTYHPTTGRVATTTYPSGLQVRYGYTTLGAPLTLTDALDASKEYWRATSFDAQNHLTGQVFGNGVVTADDYEAFTGRLHQSLATKGATVLQKLTYEHDVLGNVKTKVDGVGQDTSAYGYDELNRLTTETHLGATVTWAYDDIGNIKSRSDVGTYAYNPSGGYSLRPHAVIGVTGSVNGVTNPAYGYDANGSMESGANRTVTWTGFNKVQSIFTTTGMNRLVFSYDADLERVREVFDKGGVPQRTTTYVNPGSGSGLLYEEEVGVGGTRRKHYLSAAGRVFGVVVTDAANAITDTQYWNVDNLGSNTVVTNATGAVVERLAYEPFGKRRNSNGTTSVTGAVGAKTDRGFTQHEHLDEVGLVNMNGRVYEPALGRFGSADPLVQAPAFTQSHNRYSYTWNNPLRMVDPSGFEGDESSFNYARDGMPAGGTESWGFPGSSGGSIFGDAPSNGVVPANTASGWLQRLAERWVGWNVARGIRDISSVSPELARSDAFQTGLREAFAVLGLRAAVGSLVIGYNSAKGEVEADVVTIGLNVGGLLVGVGAFARLAQFGSAARLGAAGDRVIWSRSYSLQEADELFGKTFAADIGMRHIIERNNCVAVAFMNAGFDDLAIGAHRLRQMRSGLNGENLESFIQYFGYTGREVGQITAGIPNSAAIAAIRGADPVFLAMPNHIELVNMGPILTDPAHAAAFRSYFASKGGTGTLFSLTPPK